MRISIFAVLTLVSLSAQRALTSASGTTHNEPGFASEVNVLERPTTTPNLIRQSCNPAVITLLVRDETGKRLPEAELNTIRENLPAKVNDSRPFVSEVSIAADGETFYWPESVDWQKGDKSLALTFVNNETCTMHFTEVTLSYHDKRMRLILNIDIARRQNDRRPTIDCLPFQEGSFELDLTGWSHSAELLILASRWKTLGSNQLPTRYADPVDRFGIDA